MLQFLRVGYPVGRIKVNNRFKRGININGIKLLIPKDSIIITSRMFQILETAYDADAETIAHVLHKYYDFID